MRINKQDLTTICKRITLLATVALCLQANVVSALNVDQIFSQNFNTSHFDPTFCGNGVGNGAATNSPVIILDPGHVGLPENLESFDDKRGLRDHDTANSDTNERVDVFKVAMMVRKKLLADGYSVVMTKGGTDPKDSDANDRVGLRERADVANNTPGASLAVSIHDDPGQDWSWAQIYTQKSNDAKHPTLQRFGTKGAVTLESMVGNKDNYKKLVDDSQAAGLKMRDARAAAEGRKPDLTNANFDSRPGFDKGNIPMVQLYSTKVPWIYNEVGASPKSGHLSSKRMDQYSKGIIDGIEAAVPIDANEKSNTGANAVGGTITMQEVDTTGFKPASEALSHFKSQDLPQMKKFIPLYAKAAQAEGVPQNWEILAGLHGAESDFANSFKANSLGYSGPFQEGPSELAAYINDPAYGPQLKTMIEKRGGTWVAKGNDHLTEDQFVVLARLVFKHWVRGAKAYGLDYGKLEKGPIPFTNTVDDNNVFQQIMKRYNSGVKYEGFNGFHPPQYPWGMRTEVGSSFAHPGIATMYYMLKDWEKSGGMSTIAGVGGTQDCKQATDTNQTVGAGDCTAPGVTGRAKILACAKVYDPISYEESIRGGHQGAAKWHKEVCPKIQGKAWPYASCVLDCSGLVSVAVYDAFGYDKSWNTWALVDDNANWHNVSPNELQAGDIIEPNSGHVEIVDHVSGNTIYTFGAHTSRYPQPKQVGPSQFSKTGNYAYLRYYGPGVK